MLTSTVSDITLAHTDISLKWLMFGALLGWITLVRCLRWRRYNAIHQKYGQKWNNGKGVITAEEAQIVCHLSALYDMPFLLDYGFSFALFKTFAIPSISKLLAATKQFNQNNVSRRYADTDLLLATCFTCPISGFSDPEIVEQNKLKGENAAPAADPRGMIALARINWLHTHYRISNEEFTYALSLAILERVNWANKYGWRKISPLEEHCFYVFWAEIGRRMNIRDIPGSFEEVKTWSERFTETYMVPEQTNHEIADATVNELLFPIPEAFGLKKFAKRLAIGLLEEEVRESMMFAKQHWIYDTTTLAIMKAMSFIQGWLLLPRSAPKTTVDIRLGICPRLYPYKWAAKPWYRPEVSHGGLGYYRDKLLVALGWFAEMPGPHLKSEGYRLEEMGPFIYENRGHEEVIKNAAKLLGCPIAGPWSMEGRAGKN